MTDPTEDGDRPARPAYGPAGPPPPPGATPQPYQPQPYQPQPFPQQYAPPSYGQPAYGQSPYGQQHAAPHYAPPQYGPYAVQQPSPPGYGAPVRRRRRGLVWALVAVVVAVVAVAAVLSITVRTRVLDRSAVERDVAAQFQEHEGVAIQLDCAGSMALTTGATYRCQGTTAAGEKVTLLIRVTDAKAADYTWSEQR